MLPMCCSSSDEKSLAVQSISVTSDDTKHVNTDSTSSLSEDSDEEIEYYDGTEALPIFKSGWKENSTAPHFTDKNDVICSTEPTNIQDDVVFLVEILGRSEI